MVSRFKHLGAKLGHNSIKGQVLADFLAEMPSVEVEDKETEKCEIQNEELKSKDTWQLYTDGASRSDGSGTGLMLVSPEGKELMCRCVVVIYVSSFTFIFCQLYQKQHLNGQCTQSMRVSWIKSLLEVTATKVCVTAAKQKSSLDMAY
ncbi:hypothetical protein Tco_1334626 [Tanacetum coccineum]